MVFHTQIQLKGLKLFKIINNKVSYFSFLPGLVFLVSHPWELVCKNLIFIDINGPNVTSQAAPLCLFAQSKINLITVLHAVT